MEPTSSANPSVASVATTAHEQVHPPTIMKPIPVRLDDRESARLCNQWVGNGLTKNRAIQFLLQHLEDLGCMPPDNFIRCISCDQPAGGGFGAVEETVLRTRSLPGVETALRRADEVKSPVSPLCDRGMLHIQDQLKREDSGVSSLTIKPEIYICQQYMESELMTHKTMVHELIHAIDMCRTNMDPLHNCIHLACTEIRAENLSGECSFWKELPRMKSMAGHGGECVRRRAILSVRANPRCTARAEEYVDAAMNRCFQDVYPFERHPNQN